MNILIYLNTRRSNLVERASDLSFKAIECSIEKALKIVPESFKIHSNSRFCFPYKADQRPRDNNYKHKQAKINRLEVE